MKKIHIIGILFFSFFIIFTAIIYLFEIFDIWSSTTFLILILTIGIMFYQFERGKINSKEISLIAVLSAVSAISRLPFAAIPSVQPCTFIIICAGYVFGPIAGFMVGATTALVSNIFLGQGPWTLFQMFAWGLAGITASTASKLKIKITGLIILGAIWGFLFGWLMNLWFWIAYIYPHNIQTFVFYMSTSLGFDTLHAIGNVIFIVILGEKTIKILKRYKERFHIIYNSGNEDKISKANKPAPEIVN